MSPAVVFSVGLAIIAFYLAVLGDGDRPQPSRK